MYTSGSTGRPKGIAVPHSTLAAFATSMLREPGLVPDDVLLAVTTLSFDISLLELIVPLCVGVRVVVAGESVTADGDALAEMLERHQATTMQATPATWQLLVETGWPGRDGLRLLCGGDALPPGLAGQLRARAASVWNLYGPTECTVWATVQPVREEPASGAVPIGRAIPGTTAEVLDQALEPAPAAATGELYLGGAGVAWGYLGRPGLTAERFVPDPAGGPGSRRYRTGDLARRGADGILTFQGRTDHQVKIRGHRIELGEVEAVLAGHPGVAGCVSVAVDGRLVAYLTPPPGGAVPSVPELRRFAAERLPDYMLPASLVTLTELPLTPNGKVDQAALPAPDDSRPAVAEGYLAPRDEHERTLAAIWSELLGVARIGVHDNFLELGGDSILAVRVAGTAREQGIAFSPQQLLRAGSIAELLGSDGGANPAGSDGGADPAPAAHQPTGASRWLPDLDINRISKRLAQENGRRRSA
jgi:acyl-coenzyme A synthetase/AMP-(fatty) acid ligase/aryl carrier-like protein